MRDYKPLKRENTDFKERLFLFLSLVALKSLSCKVHFKNVVLSCSLSFSWKTEDRPFSLLLGNVGGQPKTA